MRLAGLILAATLLASSANAAETNIAVAANFADAVKEIAAIWEKRSGHKAVFSFGATGQLFTQISQGAPLDVFLSADQATAKKAVDDKHAVGGTQFTYAVGKLVLYSKDKGAVNGEQTLKDATFDKVAIANPAAAPYGAAAVEVMKKLGVYERLSPKIVQGQNITQTFQFVETGNAQVGFIALSQVVATTDGSRWLPPQSLYAPINQDAVLLTRGANNAAAKDFIAFLKGPEAAQVKEKYGYGPGM
jgi:molybdate transport system substrate-binding protein